MFLAAQATGTPAQAVPGLLYRVVKHRPLPSSSLALVFGRILSAFSRLVPQSSTCRGAHLATCFILLRFRFALKSSESLSPFRALASCSVRRDSAMLGIECEDGLWPRPDLNPQREHPGHHTQRPQTGWDSFPAAAVTCGASAADRKKRGWAGPGRRARPCRPRLGNSASDWLPRSRWARPPGGGRAGEKAGRALEGRGCLGDAGRALRGGEAGWLLNDKSAGHGWGPAPRGGEEAGGAGLRAGPGADGQAARDGSQVRVSALQGGPAKAKWGARGERVRVPGQWPLRPVPRGSAAEGRPGGGGPTRAEIGLLPEGGRRWAASPRAHLNLPVPLFSPPVGLGGHPWWIRTASGSNSCAQARIRVRFQVNLETMNFVAFSWSERDREGDQAGKCGILVPSLGVHHGFCQQVDQPGALWERPALGKFKDH
uniref:Uncharacterized protein n=1 Tax=Rangifer tarandus platyrhynchus TaxID=3082113 RepID=A0ACB0DYA6_RANTA|nr:unnamed protein product [Rangifer tarandus platyrhynchus]